MPLSKPKRLSIAMSKRQLTIATALLFGACLTVASAYVTTGLPPQKQIAWLRKMTVDICESPPGQLTHEMIQTAPDLMWAWSHAKKASVEHALAVESLVKRLVDERRAGNPEAIATTADYNCLLEGWARSGKAGAAAERSEHILNEMQERYQAGDAFVQPNLSSFKAVLMAWRLSNESFAAVRAQRILEWMIRLHQSGQNDRALPDADCFDMVLQTLARSGDKDAPAKTEAILGTMERLYETTGREKLKPRTTSFNAVLAAWAKSGRAGAAERAAAILRFMEQLSLEGDKVAAPDMVSYSTVIGAIARSGIKDSGRKAELFLNRVEERFAEGDKDLAPDTILYNSVIGCWSKSTMSKAYRRAQAILDRQTKMFESGCEHCRPDVFSFTQVMASCCMESDREQQPKAFQVAISTYQHLRRSSDKYGAPNHVTYGTMLKACARLLPTNSNERKRWTHKIFSHCVKAGCVGDMVLSRLREAAVSREYFEELMQGHTRRSIPKEWSCNVDEKSEYRKKAAAKQKRRAEV